MVYGRPPRWCGNSFIVVTILRTSLTTASLPLHYNIESSVLNIVHDLQQQLSVRTRAGEACTEPAHSIGGATYVVLFAFQGSRMRTFQHASDLLRGFETNEDLSGPLSALWVCIVRDMPCHGTQGG